MIPPHSEMNGSVAESSRFVTNELVVGGFYRSSNRVLLLDLDTKRSYQVNSPMLLGLLAFAVEPRTDESLFRFLQAEAGITEESASRLIGFCKAKDLLLSEGDPKRKPVMAARNRWRRFGWNASALYHFFTRDFPFLDYSRADAYASDQGLMRSYKGGQGEPPRFKDYPDQPFTSLEATSDSLREVSLHTLQDARFAPPTAASVDRKRLGTLLYYTFGKTGAIRFPIVEPLLRRTSPSGGARHPTEGYLTVFDAIDDIEPGLYHYSVSRQGLEQLAAGDFRSEVSAALNILAERGELEPRAVIFYTSIVERNMWRYREPRTYRVIHLDLGHLTWTSYLVALGLGIRTFAHHGIDEKSIERLFGLDPVGESVYWYMALG